MPAWSNVTQVQAVVTVDATVTTAAMTEWLEEAEGYVTDLLNLPTTFVFSAAKPKHLILREVVVMRAAIKAMQKGPTSVLTLDYAAFAADICRDIYNDCIGLLNENKAADFLEE